MKIEVITHPSGDQLPMLGNLTPRLRNLTNKICFNFSVIINNGEQHETYRVIQ